MAGQLLFNVFIAILWVLLKDESGIYLETIVTGFVIGAVIVYLMRRFFNQDFYLDRALAVLILVGIFIIETIKSSITVIKHILVPKIDLEPGIFVYKSTLESDLEITILSLLLTLTPGSVVMEIGEDNQQMFIHAMDIPRYQKDLEAALNRFEKVIKGVTKP